MQLHKQTAKKNIACPPSYYDFYRTAAHIRLYVFSISIIIHYIRTLKYCWCFLSQDFANPLCFRYSYYVASNAITSVPNLVWIKYFKNWYQTHVKAGITCDKHSAFWGAHGLYFFENKMSIDLSFTKPVMQVWIEFSSTSTLNYTAKIIFSSLFQAHVKNNSSPKQFISSIWVILHDSDYTKRRGS
jgi:hypothetical protein